MTIKAFRFNYPIILSGAAVLLVLGLMFVISPQSAPTASVHPTHNEVSR